MDISLGLLRVCCRKGIQDEVAEIGLNLTKPW